MIKFSNCSNCIEVINSTRLTIMQIQRSFSLFVFIVSLKSCTSQRRLTEGKRTIADKQYMVYIVQSNESSKYYDNWLCGGALISSRKVITSASCLTDVSHVYVIAGYKKYVNGRGIAYDPCTSKRKNRVVMTCVPKGYDFQEGANSTWMGLDIGVALVEKPYDFTDKSWRDHCSYIPKPIRISYSAEFTRADTDVVTFGWGGSYWRPNTDVTDNNSPYLQEISSMVIGKQICMDKYEDPVKTHIGQYMLCVEGVGIIDGGGNLLVPGQTDKNEYYFDTRKRFLNESSPEARRAAETVSSPALCQNDHGGPLVTWAGSEEVMIGVAVTSMINNLDNTCMNTSLFTSTYCAGKVVECLTALTTDAKIRCIDEMRKRGMYIEDKHLDWDKFNAVTGMT